MLATSDAEAVLAVGEASRTAACQAEQQENSSSSQGEVLYNF